MIIENLVNLIGPFSNQCQLVLDPFRFGPKQVVTDTKVGLNQMRVSVMGMLTQSAQRNRRGCDECRELPESR
jgi:hypothetical protein